MMFRWEELDEPENVVGNDLLDLYRRFGCFLIPMLFLIRSFGSSAKPFAYFFEYGLFVEKGIEDFVF